MSAQTFDVVYAGDDEAEWLEARKPFIGASESAAILGLSPYSTPRDVWESKQRNAQPIAESRFMTWGKRLEPVVAEWLEHDFPEVGHLLPSPGLLASRDEPWLACTPDRENTWDDDGFVMGVTELKTGSAFTRASWFEDGEPSVPPYYEVQVQQQMKIRGVRRGFVGALIGGNELMVREVEFNERFAEVLVNELGEWREKYLLGGDVPPATSRDLWRFGGALKGEGKPIVATDEIMELVAKRITTTQPAATKAKAADDEVKQRIQLFMEDATELVDPDGKVLVTWYRGEDKPATDWKALAAAHPAIVEEFTAMRQGSRTMLFKK